jgi:acetoacetyl-CoA synthetase
MIEKITEGTPLWEPPEELKERSTMTRYMRWLAEEKGHDFGGDYHALWRWSVTDLDGFWGSLWEFFDVKAHEPYTKVLGRREMPGAEWFPGATLNYAEHALRHADGRPDESAVLYRSEARPLASVSWRELRDGVAACAAGLRSLGVGRGDRVAAYLPNCPEALVAFLATASLGAVWSSCSPDFGASSVVDRVKQIGPKVLVACDGYRYGGKDHDRSEIVGRLREELPSLEATVVLPYLTDGPGAGAFEGALAWDDLLGEHSGAELRFEPVPFDHPLWVLYSSGTTGLPKAIVQGQGGILLEHLKENALHHDFGPNDRFFWYTTTGWMMWNLLVSGLLTGSTVVLYDGSPVPKPEGEPDKEFLWRFAEETRMTCFGTSAGYLASCMKDGLEPGRDFDLSALRSLGSSASPLPPEGFAWVYEHVKGDVWLFSMSGGTDLCTAFVGASPLLGVRAGELQARALGAKVEAYDEEGKAVVGEVGELVIEEPMPSMPLFLWGDGGIPGDPSGERYRESYFDVYPGVWRHGDWILIKEHGGCVIYGRSDSTINRGGVRIGTAEIYAAVEKVEGVADSLVVDVPRGPGGPSYVPLFVVLEEGTELTDDLVGKIKRRVREECSPRHVPDEVVRIPEVPKTLNSKKVEVPVKKILSGTPPDRAASRDSLRNPDALEVFAEMARVNT